MNKQGYVSLGVALCAALGVHALIFFYVQTDSLPSVSRSSIQLTLLSLPSQQENYASSAKKVKAYKTKLKPEPLEKEELKKQTLMKKKLSTDDKVVANHKREREAAVVLVPKNVQQTILASIAYPRQAKRHGWEGRAEFSLEVYQHNIKQITMLVSTGYQALDHAAKLGIASVQTLPLSDGSYHLPIEFRLQ